MRQVFGIRLFFIPAARRRVGMILAASGTALYGARAAVQLLQLRTEIRTADFPVFYAAAIDLAHGRDPYHGFLVHCPGFQWCLGGYIYPPLLALLLRPLTAFDVLGADVAWTVISHLLLVVAAWATYSTVRADLTPGSGRWLLAGSLFFLPLYQNLYSGSVGALLLVVLALAAHAYAAGRSGRAGAALAVGAVLRVTPLAMTPLLLRSRAEIRRPTGAVVALLTGLLLLGALAAATPYVPEYLLSVLPRISAGTDFVSNVSLPGVALRFQRVLLGHRLPGSGLFGVALAAGAIGITWWRSFGVQGKGGRAVAFAAFLAATSLVSSVTWNYHLVNELLVIALLWPWLRQHRWATPMAVASYPLLWVYSDGVLAALGVPAGTPAGAAVFLLVTSLNAVGMLLLWLAALAVLEGLRQEAGTAYTRAAPLRATSRHPARLPGSSPPNAAS